MSSFNSNPPPNGPDPNSTPNNRPTQTQPSMSDRMINSYGEKAAGEAGKKTVDYVATDENIDEAKIRAQQELDKVKGWWSKTFPCFASAT